MINSPPMGATKPDIQESVDGQVFDYRDRVAFSSRSPKPKMI